MKRISFILLIFGIMFFIACSDKEEIPKNDFKIDFSKFSLSVDNNVLIFKDIESLMECTNYLNQIGEDNFDAFEITIGFESYRRSYRDNHESEPYPDNLIASLMNSENKIIVGNKLFEISQNKDSVSIYNIEGELNTCAFENSKPDLKLSVYDDIYSFVDNQNRLKSTLAYCGQQVKKGTVTDFSQTIKIKAGNYDWVFWNVLEATISKGSWGGTITIGLSTNDVYFDSFGRYNAGCDLIHLYYNGGNGSSYTISRSLNPLRAYSFNVIFEVSDSTPPGRSEGYWISVDCKPDESC